MVELGYRLNVEIKQLREVQEDNRKLRLEKAVLTDPDRVEKLARAIGMRRPDKGQIRESEAP